MEIKYSSQWNKEQTTAGVIIWNLLITIFSYWKCEDKREQDTDLNLQRGFWARDKNTKKLK